MSDEIYFKPSDKLLEESHVETAKTPAAKTSPPGPDKGILTYAALFLSLLALGVAIFWNPRAISCATVQNQPLNLKFRGEGGHLLIDQDVPINMSGEINIPIVFEIPNGTELMAYGYNGSVVIFQTAAPTYVKANVSIPAEVLFKNRSVHIYYSRNLNFTGYVNTTVGEVFGDLCSWVS